MLQNLLKKKSTWIVCHDLLAVVFSWYLAWLIRHNLSLELIDWALIHRVLPIILLIQGFVFWRYQLHRGLWQFFSLSDLLNIFRSVVWGSLLLTLTLFVFFRLQGIPRSILVLYPILLACCLSGSRLMYRCSREGVLELKLSTANKTPVLIIGMGRAAESLIRDMARHGNYRPVAVLDDKPQMHGTRIHGVEVHTGTDRLNELAQEYAVREIIIADPSIGETRLQQILDACEQIDIPAKILQDMQDFTSVDTVRKLRELTISDLLGRQPVEIDWQPIRSGIQNRRLLITGGGGSIGRELCMQVARLGVQELIAYEQNELNLYNLERKLRTELPDTRLRCVLGDICDLPRLRHVFSSCTPDIVFHAAAYKHVPILERDPREAVRNNALGTKQVIDTAAAHHCQRLILISSDKAVNPCNVLGMSKRAAELYVQTANQSTDMRCITVRFGNVLDSDGSVVPLFREQIAQGGPVTVTDPNICRFFMTIHEACQLILQSAIMGNGGETYVLDMGKPVNIRYLAEQMIRLSSQKSYSDDDIRIRYTGLRPGEKIAEELFSTQEVRHPTKNRKIWLAKQSCCNDQHIQEQFEALIQYSDAHDEAQMLSVLRGLTTIKNPDDHSLRE